MEQIKTKAELTALINEGVTLVDFYADWCGPCKMIAPILVDLEKDLQGQAKIGKVNVDEAQELASMFNVQSIPTLIIFKNGSVVEKAMGYKPKEALKALVTKNL